MFDKIINKIGIDKILHFCVGALITFTISNLAMLQEGTIGKDNLWWAFAGLTIAFVFECIKEFIIDIRPDVKDFIATILGGLFVFVVNAIGIFFYISSH